MGVPINSTFRPTGDETGIIFESSIAWIRMRNLYFVMQVTLEKMAFVLLFSFGPLLEMQCWGTTRRGSKAGCVFLVCSCSFQLLDLCNKTSTRPFTETDTFSGCLVFIFFAFWPFFMRKKNPADTEIRGRYNSMYFKSVC